MGICVSCLGRGRSDSIDEVLYLLFVVLVAFGSHALNALARVFGVGPDLASYAVNKYTPPI